MMTSPENHKPGNDHSEIYNLKMAVLDIEYCCRDSYPGYSELHQ